MCSNIYSIDIWYTFTRNCVRKTTGKTRIDVLIWFKISTTFYVRIYRGDLIECDQEKFNVSATIGYSVKIEEQKAEINKDVCGLWVQFLGVKLNCTMNYSSILTILIESNVRSISWDFFSSDPFNIIRLSREKKMYIWVIKNWCSRLFFCSSVTRQIQSVSHGVSIRIDVFWF